MKLTLTLIIGLSFLIGCSSRGHTTRIVEQQPTQTVQKIEEHTVAQSNLPPAPQKIHKAKKVEDSNYSDKYMYPDDGVAAKKDPVTQDTPTTVSNTMSKEECIAMISQEKFDKYTAMFGSEASSIKRCTMLKAMKK